ncbi:MAG: GvpL/GvpF family gas vesicle protein [Pseudomonadota bacterium]
MKQRPFALVHADAGKTNSDAQTRLLGRGIALIICPQDTGREGTGYAADLAKAHNRSLIALRRRQPCLPAPVMQTEWTVADMQTVLDRNSDALLESLERFGEASEFEVMAPVAPIREKGPSSGTEYLRAKARTVQAVRRTRQQLETAASALMADRNSAIIDHRLIGTSTLDETARLRIWCHQSAASIVHTKLNAMAVELGVGFRVSGPWLPYGAWPAHLWKRTGKTDDKHAA